VIRLNQSFATQSGVESAGPIKLQSMRGPAEGLHEELWRADLQDGVSDVYEILQEVGATVSAFESRALCKCLIAALTSGIGGFACS
jgi:hypothetical protein